MVQLIIDEQYIEEIGIPLDIAMLSDYLKKDLAINEMETLYFGQNSTQEENNLSETIIETRKNLPKGCQLFIKPCIKDKYPCQFCSCINKINRHGVIESSLITSTLTTALTNKQLKEVLLFAQNPLYDDMIRAITQNSSISITVINLEERTSESPFNINYYHLERIIDIIALD